LTALIIVNKQSLQLIRYLDQSGSCLMNNLTHFNKTSQWGRQWYSRSCRG